MKIGKNLWLEKSFLNKILSKTDKKRLKSIDFGLFFITKSNLGKRFLGNN